MRHLAAVTPVATVASIATVVPSVVAAIVPAVGHVVLEVTAMTPGVPIPMMPTALVAVAAPAVVPPITVAIVPVVTVAVAVVAIVVPVHLLDDGEGEREREGYGRQRQARPELHPRTIAVVVVRECGRRRSESDQHGRTQDQHCEAPGAPRLRISNVSVALHDGSFLPEPPVPDGRVGGLWKVGRGQAPGDSIGIRDSQIDQRHQ